MPPQPAVQLVTPLMHPDFRLRLPSRELVQLPADWFHMSTEPVYGRLPVRPGDNDLTKHGAGPPFGQRIVVSGRVLDSDGRGVPSTLIELWQANASGRYVDRFGDRPGLPVDPNFRGAGRCLTDSGGRYLFRTIQPAGYAGPPGTSLPFRAAHLHMSLFGPDLSNRLVTACYFEGDPLLRTDFVINSISDPKGRERLIARFDPATTKLAGPESEVGYHWDIILRGRTATPMER